MRSAALRIYFHQDALHFEWCGPDGVTLNASRSIHPDDVECASGTGLQPPTSYQELEAVGVRIFSRLLERQIRERIFQAAPCHLTLDTNLPDIPWELAYTDGRFLADHHAVGRVPGVARKPAGSTVRVLLVSNPTDDLPYSGTEIADITRRLKNIGRLHISTLSAAEATRHGILSALESHPFDVIHFSCHSEFNAACPNRSHLVAYDGPLTAVDLSQIHMAAVPALVVLNACGSVREGHGRIGGLTSALRAAGVPAVLGSLWPVNNKPSAYLTSVLYASLASGRTLGESLRTARAETRRAYAFDRFQSWAAYRLNGSPEMILVSDHQASVTGRIPLLEREEDLQALQEAWTEARTGRGAVVFITGPEGSGKTRLVEEWLGSVIEPPCLDLSLRDQRGPGDILALNGLPWFPKDAHRTAASVLDWCVSHGGGIVMCDDFDVAPKETSSVLDALRDQARDVPILVLLCASRVPALGKNRARTRIIRLVPLTPAGVSAAFSSLDAQEPAKVTTMWPGDAERSALSLPHRAEAADFSESLPEAELTVLRAGAVLGETFSEDQMNALLQSSVSRYWRALERLIREQWLEEMESGTYRFRRVADRDSILRSFRPLSRKQEWHRRAAKLPDLVNMPGERARHWKAAGDDSHAAAAYREAFWKAAEAGDPASVLLWYGEWETCGGADSGPSCQAVLGDAHSETGDWLGAIRAWKSCLNDTSDTAERYALFLKLADASLGLGQEKDAADWLALAESAGIEMGPSVLAVRSRVNLRKGEAEAAVRDARAGLVLAQASKERPLVARCALAGAEASLLLPDAAGADALCAVGLDSLDTADSLSHALQRVRARAMQYAGDYEGAEHLLNTLAESQRIDYAAHERASTLLALAELLRDQGRLETALERLNEAAVLGKRCRQPDLLSSAAGLEASIRRRQGIYSAAWAAALSAEEIAASAHIETGIIHAMLQKATVHAETGCLAPALSLAREAIDRSRAAAYAFGEAWGWNTAGLVYLERGDSESADSVFRKALEVSTAIHGHIGQASALCYLGWSSWQSGWPDSRVFAEAEDAAARIAYRAVQYPAAFGRALASEQMSNAEEALKGVESLNMGGLAAWLRARRGAWRLEHGLDEALEDLASAYRVARRLGMKSLQARAAGDLARLYTLSGDTRNTLMAAEAAELWQSCLVGWMDAPPA